MTSPVTLFAPLGALQDVGTLATPTPRLAPQGSGAASTSHSARVDWSGDPGTGTPRQPADMQLAQANDGIALAQTAGNALDRVAGALRGMRALAGRAGTAEPDERATLEAQFQALGAAVRRVLEGTRSDDGRAIFGADADTITFRASNDAEQGITVTTHDLLGNDAVRAVTSGTPSGIGDLQLVPPALTEHLEHVMEQIDGAATVVEAERSALATTELRFDAALAEMLDAAQEQALAGRGISSSSGAASAAQALGGQIRQDPGPALFALASAPPLRVLGLLTPG